MIRLFKSSAQGQRSGELLDNNKSLAKLDDPPKKAVKVANTGSQSFPTQAVPPSLEKGKKAFREAVENNAFDWENVQFDDIPSTSFASANAAQSKSRGLFQQNPVDELKDVAMGADGRLKPLNKDQRKEVLRNAVFTVESKAFPGRCHTWRLTRTLQNGRKKTMRVIRKRYALAWSLIRFSVLHRFQPDYLLSVYDGLHSIGYAVWRLVDLLFGIRQEAKTVPDSHLWWLNQYTQTWLQSTTVNKRQHNHHILVRNSQTLKSQTAAQDVDAGMYAFMTTQDWFDGKGGSHKSVVSIVRPILDSIREEVNREFSQVELQLESDLMKTLAKDQGKGDKASASADDDILQIVADRKTEEYNRRFLEKVMQSGRLKSVFPELPSVLSVRGRTLVVITRILEDMDKDLVCKEKEIRESIQGAHRIRSFVSEWLESKVEKEMEGYRKKVEQRYFRRLEDSLSEESRDNSSVVSMMNEWKRFRKQRSVSRETKVYETQAATKRPTRTFTVLKRIWRQKNWVKTKTSNHWTLSKNQYPSVSTDQFMWRSRLFFLRCWCWTMNTMYWIVIANLWLGQLSIKSLFKKEPYTSAWQIDSRTGAIIKKYHTQTLFSRLRALWTFVHQSRKQFLEREDDAFLPRANTNCCNFVYLYFFYGFVGTILILVLQPIATVVNVFVTTALLVVAIPLCPVGVLLRGLCTLIFYDPDIADDEEDPNIFPLLYLFVWRIALRGFVQVLMAVTSVFLLPLASILVVLISYLTAALRTIYDFFAFHLIVKRIGRVPVADSSVAYRVGGPGITSTFHSQVTHEFVLEAMRAKLELIELQVYREQKESQLRQPQDHFLKVVRHLVDGVIKVEPGTVALEGEELKQRHDHLENLVKQRSAMLQQFCSLGGNVRQTRDNLLAVVVDSENVVTEFCRERILQRYQSEVHFWQMHGLAVGNWKGLTLQLLKSIFGDAFLEPLEVADERYRLNVQPPKLKDMILGVFSGKYKNGLERQLRLVEGRTGEGQIGQVTSSLVLRLKPTDLVDRPTQWGLSRSNDVKKAIGALVHVLYMSYKEIDKVLATPSLQDLSSKGKAARDHEIYSSDSDEVSSGGDTASNSSEWEDEYKIVALGDERV